MFNAKLLFLFCAVVLLVAESVVCQLGPRPGGVTQLQGKELEEATTILKNSLAKLSSGEGPKYTLTKLMTASNQVVVGNVYRFHAELEDENKTTKTCDVAVWPQPWMDNVVEVTFECNGEPKMVKKHSA